MQLPFLKNQFGFSLLETIIATVIFSVGIIAAFRPLLVSTDALNMTNNRLEASVLLNEKIWEIKDRLERDEGEFRKEMDQKIIGEKRIFDIDVESEAIEQDGELKNLKFVVSWKHGRKIKSLTRELYVFVPVSA